MWHLYRFAVVMCLYDCHDLQVMADGLADCNCSCLLCCVAGFVVPPDISERIITKSQTVSLKMLSLVQLDPETLSFLVARDVISDENAMLLRDESKSHKDRIFSILRPAVVHGGKRSLEAFYRTLVQTKTSRLGHAELAEDIKKRGERCGSHSMQKC